MGKGLGRIVKYRKFTIKPIRVTKKSCWIYCEIFDPDGEEWGESEACETLRQTVTRAKLMIEDYQSQIGAAYFEV